MKRFFAAIAFAALSMVAPLHPAISADLSTRKATAIQAALPTTDPFTGWYVGVHGDRGWDTSGQNVFVTPQDAATLAASLNGSKQGFGFGAHVGAGERFGGIWYLGAEADWDVTNLTGTQTSPGLVTLSSKDSWFGTVRARGGLLLVPNVLFYGTAGVAYGDPSGSFSLGNATFNTQQTKTGWTWGAGAELAFTDHWIGRVEYLRVDLGHVTVTNGNPATVTLTSGSQADLLRAGLSYKF